MNAIPSQGHAHPAAGFAKVCSAVLDELLSLAAALLQPSKIIDEVERMRGLQLQAQRCEITEPARAAALYRRAARIGLR